MIRSALPACAVSVVLAGCSSSSSKATAPIAPPNLPQAKLARADTSTSDVLAWLPAGAEVVLELDLARVRGNPVVGPLYARLVVAAAGIAPAGMDYDVLGQADQVVLASYGVGTGRPESLVVVRGGQVPDPGELGVRVDEYTIALGTSGVLGRFEATRVGQGDAVADDEVFTRLRDAAMPERATAASIRLTARLPFDARVEVGKQLGADAVPAAVSLWGDVIDDLAVVALLSGEGEEGEALAAELRGWRARMSRHPLVRELFLGHLVRDVEIDGAGELARLVFIVNPRKLERVARRLSRDLAVQ